MRRILLLIALFISGEAHAANNEIYATVAPMPPILPGSVTYYLSDGNVHADYSDETNTPGYLDGPELAVFDWQVDQQAAGCAPGVTWCATIRQSQGFLSSAGATRPHWGTNSYGMEAAAIYYVYRDLSRNYFDAYNAMTTRIQDVADEHELVVMLNRPESTGCSGSCMRPHTLTDDKFRIFRGSRPVGPVLSAPYYDRPRIFLANGHAATARIPVHEFGHYYNRVVARLYGLGGGFDFNQGLQEEALDEGLGYWYASDYTNTYYIGRWHQNRVGWEDLYPTYSMFAGNSDPHFLGDVITSALWHAREESGCNKIGLRRAVLDRVDRIRANTFGASDPFDGGSIVRGFAFEVLSQAVSSGACSEAAARKMAKIFAGHQLLPTYVDQADASGLNQSSDLFGHALATGDFDNDGYDDMAVGSPYEDDGSTANVGVVRVFYGSSVGVVSGGFNRTETINQTLGGAALEANDMFGAVLTAGDFNRDGYADLAVGTPAEDIGAVADAGYVQIFYGSSNGLVPANVEAIDQALLGSSVEAGDRLGAALASGDFNSDGFSDLAVGSPGEDLPGGADAGYLFVLFGSSAGLVPINLEAFRQSDLASDDGTGDQFGFSLATGDFDRDGYADVVVGAPFEDESNAIDSGYVFVLYGSYAGLAPIRSEKFSQASLASTSENDDQFGRTLAAGDFNGDGWSDLAIAAPYEDLGAATDAGFMFVMYGGSYGLLPAVYGKWDQASLGWADESNDHLGFAMATGDLDGDGFDELLVGVPHEDTGSTVDGGFVHFYSGSSSGLIVSGALGKDQTAWGSAQSAGDQLGYSLATGDFDGDGDADFAIGARGKDRDGAASAGVVYAD